MDEELKEAKNHLSTTQSCLQELQQIADLTNNSDAKYEAENMEKEVYTLAELFGFQETDF